MSGPGIPPAVMPVVLGIGTHRYSDLGVTCLDLADLAFASGSDRFHANRPVIAHPPRHACARLNMQANGRHRQRERDQAMWALDQVRAWGGVLEHPAHSSLWTDADLPPVGAQRDQCGGITLPVWLSWWGSDRPHPTWLYLVGYDRHQMPAMPLQLGGARSGAGDGFARWLLDLAVTIGNDQAWRYGSQQAIPC